MASGSNSQGKGLADYNCRGNGLFALDWFQFSISISLKDTLFIPCVVLFPHEHQQAHGLLDLQLNPYPEEEWFQEALHLHLAQPWLG